jgi:hypothetical protein
MMKKRMIHRVATVALLGTLATTGSVAFAMQSLPPVQHSGAVAYINGGVGDEEAKAMENAQAHWPLTMVFAKNTKPHAEFVADVNAVVRDAMGEPVLKVDDAGPIVLAKLAPGDYTVEATRQGKAIHQKVRVKSGEPARIELLWP